MKKFICVKRQSGEGCDYTIGCGVRVDVIHAETEAEAQKRALNHADGWEEHFEEVAVISPDRLKDYVRDYICDMPGQSDDRSLSSFVLYEICSETDLILQLDKDVNYLRGLVAANQAEIKEAQERARYEELKKKFEKGNK